MRDTVLEQYLAKMGFLRDDYLSIISNHYSFINSSIILQDTIYKHITFLDKLLLRYGVFPKINSLICD